LSEGEIPRTPDEAFAAPVRAGSFEIVDELGRGGMGVVYRARDLKLDREVALKRPLPSFAVDPEFQIRFMTEARTASKLMHPNITTVFEVFEEEETPWLVMELIEGDSLRSLLKERVPLPFEDVLHHAEGLTDALRAAHTAGVLHRDINPNNILVGRDGRARLTDFGLARLWDESGGNTPSEATTRAHTRGAAGTRGYMSPEQILGKNVDPRSDLFSLGVVLYEMCTGQPAFARGGEEHWIEALLHQEPEPISRLNQDIPVELQEIVRKATAKRPFQRYQSASEMLQDIRALRRRMQSDWSQTWTGVARRNARRRMWGTVGIVAAIAVVASATLLFWRLDDPGPPELVGTHRRLTSSPGWDGQPALSPDGTMAVYTSDESGNPDIWVVHVAGDEPLQRTRDLGSDSAPTWFPDGGSLAFVSDRDGAPAIWRLPVFSGSAAKMLSNAEQPAVSPDGKFIAFITPGHAGLKRIAVAPLNDLRQVEILTGDDDGLWDHREPAWSPDSRTICYADQRDLWLVPGEGGPAIRLTADAAPDFEPTWSPDGRYVIFASTREDSMALWSIPAKGGEPVRLTAGTSGERSPSVASHLPWLAYCTCDSNANAVVMDRRTGERLVLPSSKNETFPILTPDGRAVIFHSDRSGGSELWLQPLNGLTLDGHPRRLTDHPGTVALPDVSPDGRWIAYQRVLNRQRDIWLVPTSGGPSVQFTDDPAPDLHPVFSPTGDRIAWVSERSGVENVWVAEVADGGRRSQPVQMTHGDSADLYPAWSPDGTRLAYVEVKGYFQEVLVKDLTTDAPPVKVTTGAGARQVRWEPSGNSLLVSGSWGGDSLRVRSVSLSDGAVRPFEPELVLGPKDGFDAGWFTVGKGGALLAYDTLEQRGDLWLAELANMPR